MSHTLPGTGQEARLEGPILSRWTWDPTPGRWKSTNPTGQTTPVGGPIGPFAPSRGARPSPHDWIESGVHRCWAGARSGGSRRLLAARLRPGRSMSRVRLPSAAGDCRHAGRSRRSRSLRWRRSQARSRFLLVAAETTEMRRIPEWIVCRARERSVAEGVIACPGGPLSPWPDCLACRFLESADDDRVRERSCSTDLAEAAAMPHPQSPNSSTELGIELP